MSCCGKKRQEISSSYSRPENIRNEEEAEVATVFLESDGSQTAAIFRYTGSSYLEVEGIFHQRVYKFSRRMPELVIMADDVAVMRAYPELIELKASSLS